MTDSTSDRQIKSLLARQMPPTPASGDLEQQIMAQLKTLPGRQQSRPRTRWLKLYWVLSLIGSLVILYQVAGESLTGPVMTASMLLLVAGGVVFARLAGLSISGLVTTRMSSPPKPMP